MTRPPSADLRARLIETLRRDLIGPGPDDVDLARERLKSSENPSRWYLTGFIAPAEVAMTGATNADDPLQQEDTDHEADVADAPGAGGAAGDAGEPDAPNARRRFLPSSIGLTVLLPPEVREIEARVSWGDYRTEPPLPESVLVEQPEGQGAGEKKPRPPVEWVRVPREAPPILLALDGSRGRKVVPDSAAAQRSGGGLELDYHMRDFAFRTPDGGVERVRALTVFLVNRRAGGARRQYADVTCAFQVRLELFCEAGFKPRHDLSSYDADDIDLRLADLHYRDVKEYAVGRNCAAAWEEGEGRKIRRVFTEPMPIAEVERVAPNENIADVEFGMEALARLAAGDGAALVETLAPLTRHYADWIAGERAKVAPLPPRRRETAERLIEAMERARGRIGEGMALLGADDRVRLAFAMMNRAVADAARRRNAGPSGDPARQKPPTWRPFQLAFILLNLSGLAGKTHDDREIVDLLFFPTGGGKTEAYLGLAAFTIALRRLRGPGVLGAGVSVIMRYTLRLLTLDQLSRAAGVICALELMRAGDEFLDQRGRRLLGDWPIEIGLWVGSDASPNRLGGRGEAGDDTAVTRVRSFKRGKGKAPAPLKACPWCGTDFTEDSFACTPNDVRPTNLEIRCVNPACDFTRGRPLPILTVDEPIYRRLPAFLIATVDKFAALPWVGESGAFFGHVGRFDPAVGFYGASEPALGRPLYNGWKLDPPDLIIQDELHLISGPLGTVAGLYETAIDQLATRDHGGRRVRPKIVASTATVRRAETQIRALFDRQETQIFPPPGVDRGDSFFARTVPSSINPARIYLGLAAQGRGPKLVFLRGLTTLLAAAQAEFEKTPPDEAGRSPADPYLTALCYFNALRELGGARRIVEDEVRDRVSRYGHERRRLILEDRPFADRRIAQPIELTSRVSTDDVALAKKQLEGVFGQATETVDVALATNMISVGLDITRLGLMLVQGQPKTAAEYIQATSRVGRDHDRPGLVVTILNLHKPRDRTHFEQFGQFHRTFYRAVEATSVTPWSSRALDRALAAIVVAIARHIDPALTPKGAVRLLKDHPDVRRKVRDAIVARAPEQAVVGGRAQLAALIDSLFDDWAAVVSEQTAVGGQFTYSESGKRLLHAPLDAGLENLSAPHQRFVAGRSMRDVEHAVHLKVRDPRGQPIAEAKDIA